MMLCLVNPRHSAALTVHQLPYHRPEHRSPLSGRVTFNVYPGLKHLGFYEAEFVKTRCENSFLFIFRSFWPASGNNRHVWLWCLIAAVRGLRAPQ
jgi:hypothetical protein